MLPGSLKIVFSPFKKQMHHRAYGCGIKFSDERKILSQLDTVVDEVKFYTDSQIVLHYLHSESEKHPVFITNRLNEIRLRSTFSEWNFVPGNKNPADFCTRPSCIKQIT